MSYLIEISKNDVRNMALTLVTIPCLLFIAGFLTASFSQSRVDTLSASVKANDSLTASPIDSIQTISAISEIIEPAIMMEEELPLKEIDEVIEETPAEVLAFEEAPMQPLKSDDAPQINPLFSVQVAAFQKASNAIDYAVQLKEKGYPAEITVESNASNTSIYKVLYGSFDQDQAIESASDFSLQENRASFIIARS